MRSAVASGRARAKANDVEGPIHRSVLAYLRQTLPYAFLIHHCANKPRSERQGAREKALGAIAGWPDLAIYGRRETDDRPAVWFMEIKPPRVSVPAHQRDLHDRLQDIGFAGVRVVRSIEDAKRAVFDWGLPSNDTSLRAFATGGVAR